MSIRSFFLKRDQIQNDDKFVLFSREKIIVKGNSFIWGKKQVFDYLPTDSDFLLIDSNDEQFIVVDLKEDISVVLSAEKRSLRSLLFNESDVDFSVAGKSSQLLNWYRNHRYCGICGNKNSRQEEQRALRCTICDEHYFPRINPCAIVLVTRGREILLARSARFRTGFYSCLAGFIEIGESAEDTVLREVKEEVGIAIENIRYVKSQSWPFPSQLMLGFHADYKSGDIVPEAGEIEEAEFYDIDNLPNVPSPKVSVAGELIKIYIDKIKREAL